ncbi:hypothetical protein PPYR_07562 [Photinus pyralis]|uniref:CRAL-TRIO domain-containing protein n=1 Tax=Photinus pyralis TaxID=7054 RepID=A0A5N4AQT6_PHOPY|nr:alpha-tocopherol transfer protein-like [Photinus pyralis]XP_031341898.1 alpha-tocopherol transfer protein-like [Photinus pyralis]KAB0799681.1 hypothetical protein PPYR_07561 [Photinus pyralis]KAB0799682.1 hypothetical protein PPYR_07562 [Photinus pyralis]
MATQFGFSVRELFKLNRVSEEGIDAIKTWQSGTKDPKLSDQQIALFLIACNGNHEFAMKTIQAYIKVKTGTPKLFKGWNISNENLQKILSVVNMAVLPKRYSNSAIITTHFKDTDPMNFDFNSFCQLCCMTVEGILIDDHPPDDVILIIDLKGVTAIHLMGIEMKLLGAFLEYGQDCMPLRIQTIHVLNANYLTYAGYKMFQLFATSDEPSKVQFYQDGESLDKFHEAHVPKKYLPRDYGGDLESSGEYHEQNVQKLSRMQYHLDALDQQFFPSGTY